jgi:hypothetical protein
MRHLSSVIHSSIPPPERPSLPLDRTIKPAGARPPKMWNGTVMPAKSIPGRRADAVTQFSVFTPNRLGRLNELVRLFHTQNVHVLALTVLDTSDSAIIRVVVDEPEQAADLMRKHEFPFTQSDVVAVEVQSSDEFNRLIAALLEAEININYLYSFIPHSHGKSIIGLSMEDNEIAEQVLRRHQFLVLKQADISR